MKRLNKFFLFVLGTLAMLGAEMGCAFMLRVGPPLFKVLVVGVMIVVIWIYIHFFRELFRKPKNKKDET